MEVNPEKWTKTIDELSESERDILHDWVSSRSLCDTVCLVGLLEGTLTHHMTLCIASKIDYEV